MTARPDSTGRAGEPDWSRFRRRVPGAPADVSLYLLDVREVRDWALGATGCLTAEEAERARRIHHGHRRELFLVSRVVLRHVLAHRSGWSPGALPVVHDPLSGAPEPIADLAPSSSRSTGERVPGAGEPPRCPPPTSYSLARAPGVVGVVLAQRPVGVDVEELQSPSRAAALLEVLHPADRARLRRKPARRRPRAVTDAWVRVEALLKARGVGLALDPAGVPVGGRRRSRTPGGWRVTGVRAGRRRRVRLAVAWHAGEAAPQRRGRPRGAGLSRRFTGAGSSPSRR